MQQMLIKIFNDKIPQNVETLKCAISSLPGIKNLKYTPEVSNIVISEEISKKFEKMRVISDSVDLVSFEKWTFQRPF